MWRYLCCCGPIRPGEPTPATQPDQGTEMVTFLPRQASWLWTPLAHDEPDEPPAPVSPWTGRRSGRRSRSCPPIHMAVQRVLVEVRMQCIRARHEDAIVKVEIEDETRFVVMLQDRARGCDHQSRAAVIQWLADAGTIILGRAGMASRWEPSVYTDPVEEDDDPWAYSVAMRFHENVAYM